MLSWEQWWCSDQAFGLQNKGSSTGLVSNTVYSEILAPLYFALFALIHEGEFKTGLIEMCIKDNVAKLGRGPIQDWANQL